MIISLKKCPNTDRHPGEHFDSQMKLCTDKKESHLDNDCGHRKLCNEGICSCGLVYSEDKNERCMPKLGCSDGFRYDQNGRCVLDQKMYPE